MKNQSFQYTYVSDKAKVCFIKDHFTSNSKTFLRTIVSPQKICSTESDYVSFSVDRFNNPTNVQIICCRNFKDD